MNSSAYALKNDYANAVAIIGLAGRFPGAGDPETLWDNLCKGWEAPRRMSDQELRDNKCPQSHKDHPDFVPVTACLDDVDRFDAEFFGFTPAEAREMDPQRRLMLEISWHALENAGYIPGSSEAGLTGVFAGSAPSLYWNLHAGVNHQDYSTMAYNHGFMLNSQDFTSTWLSYKLNLRGPSLSIQTACSTGLVAVAVGCQHLLDYSCDTALAIAGSVFCPRGWGYLAESGGILSADGHCRPFDASAGGTVMGEGVCAVVLKRLSDAIADKDRIEAVIRGYGINNDGSAKAGFTAPSASGQAEVIRLAHASAGISDTEVSYVEAHGTGTYLGDPIEFAGLCEAFSSPRQNPCILGSVKANLGHLNIAAGMASLIKVILMLRHDVIPPLINCNRCNPEIAIENSPFRFALTKEDWPESLPRLAGVSSFGFGGTNCHVVIEKTPLWAAHSSEVDFNPLSKTTSIPQSQVLFFSAPDKAGVKRCLQGMADFFSQNESASLRDAAWVMSQCRKVFPWRTAVIASTAKQAAQRLLQDNVMIQQSTSAPRIVLVLPLLYEKTEILSDGCLKEMTGLLDEVDHLSAYSNSILHCPQPLAHNFLGVHAFTGLLKAYGLEPDAVVCPGSFSFTSSVYDMLFRKERPANETLNRLHETIDAKDSGLTWWEKRGKAEPESYHYSGNQQLEHTKLHCSSKTIFLDCGLPSTLREEFKKQFVTDSASGSIWLQAFTETAHSGFAHAWSEILAVLFIEGLLPLIPRGGSKRLPLPGYPFAKDTYWLPLPDIDADRSAASALDLNHDSEGTENRNSQDEVLEIWRDAFGIPSMTAEDDFFLMGGTSMTAIEIIAEIRLRMGIHVTMPDFMRARTVNGLLDGLAEL